MELLAIVLLWPLLILTLSVVAISTYDVAGGFVFPALFLFIILAFGFRSRLGGTTATTPESEVEGLDGVRRSIVAFSIGLLLPIWVKYLLEATSNSLVSIILGLILGFGVLTWGMFIKNYKVISYANSIGGALVIIYLYFQLWNLGQLAQVIGAAFGLVMAVVISAVKFREKLT